MTVMRNRHSWLGLVFLLVIGMVVAGAVALYRGAFEDTAEISVKADRAGLTLATGSSVKLRGVEIGEVRRIRPQRDGVLIDLRIQRELLDRIPSSASAQIVPPTAFGAKYVQLTARGDAGPIQEGAVIAADHVNVEVNEAFENLTLVLDAARPSEVNNALTALATALDGRGASIGELVTSLDRYLEALNPAAPQLASDLKRAEAVLRVYADSAPDLLRTARNVSVTSSTLVERQRALHDLSTSLAAFSTSADPAVRDNADSLAALLGQLAPVTATLEKYSPELPCFILGLAHLNATAEAPVGGKNPGITTFTRLQPGKSPYLAAEHLPVVGETRGPNCFGLPVISAAEAAQPLPAFGTGADPAPSSSGAGDIAGTLFGTLLGGGPR